MTAASQAERDANAIIEQQLDARAAAVEAAANADVLTYIGPMYPPADDAIKDALDSLTDRRATLLCILETSGGYIETAERIARIFRHHYSRVDFLVPNYAMSAGTILVMSGDGIYMDYASTLGPIDPQVNKGDGLVPALGYLEQYQRLVQKSAEGKLTTVEAMYFVQNFDAAELYRYEQERELSIALLKDWLVKYKFKDWKQTETRKKTVTKKMRTDRARMIAEKLNKTGHWHSHSRGIPMEVLRRDLKLLVEDFGEDTKLAPAVRDYYHLLKDYLMKRSHETFVLHRKGFYVGF
ncbi:MAG: serine dehydrogenasease [Solirubrobacterales bacterium]